MTDKPIMNDTTNTQPDYYPFIIEGESILETLNLTASEVADMITAGCWNEAYASEDPADTASGLIFDGPNVVVTQVATTTDGSLALAIVGTRANRKEWACITYHPQGWRKVTCAGFYKDREGHLMMAGGYYDPTIQVLSVCG